MVIHRKPDGTNYDRGDSIVINFAVVDALDSPADPDEITVVITRGPVEVANVAYSGGAGDINRSAVGAFDYTFKPTVSGGYLIESTVIDDTALQDVERSIIPVT